MMDKRFKPQEVEKKIYREWEKSGAFTPKTDPKKKPFTVIMPPPNANGRLHLGHALFVALEDIMVRYHRMLGDPSLWVPGADHAGIATQVSFEKDLAKKNKTKFDLGRKEFYRQVYEFSQKNKEIMYSQLRALGASCDWTREKFTLDPKISRQVLLTFEQLNKDGLVYRGERLVNWCPRCATTLADLEVDHVEEKTKLWYIKYPLAGGKPAGFSSAGSYITVATTRPETMLGDTAVAVNPKDKRYRKLVGKTVLLPIAERNIPIVADEAVDPEFGTGAVKVTPAHDPLDFEIGQRHHLSAIQVIGFDGRMTEKAGKYEGMLVEDAREKVVQVLEKQSLIEKEEPYEHSVGVCDRCETKIEPLVSLQWFIKTAPLAKPAMEAVRKGKVHFLPQRFEKVYFHWMENIRDWPVSRQLWWGQRLPIWYCGVSCLSPLQLATNPDLKSKKEGCGETIISAKEPRKCHYCGRRACLIQDPDTFDTWFSSGQWPFNVLGYPNGKDYQYFYPTSVMETGYEIIFLWVARMIMLGIYRTGKPPFHTVYLHGIVKDRQGRKMSKSKGNAVDPIDMIERYGADALRMSLVVGNTPGIDMSLSEEKIVGYRNFANKIWNIGRFAKLMLKDVKKQEARDAKLCGEDEDFLAELAELVKKTTENLEKLQFSPAGGAVYDFIWHRLADAYIEQAKDRLRAGDSSAQTTLYRSVTTSLRLLHPFMPFVTEAVWKELGEKDSLITSSWPA